MPLYKEHLSLLVPEKPGVATPAQMTWAAAAELPLCLLSANMHGAPSSTAAFASVGKSPVPQIESDSIVNLAFTPMASGIVTIVPRAISTSSSAPSRDPRQSVSSSPRWSGRSGDLGRGRSNAANGEGVARPLKTLTTGGEFRPALTRRDGVAIPAPAARAAR